MTRIIISNRFRACARANLMKIHNNVLIRRGDRLGLCGLTAILDVWNSSKLINELTMLVIWIVLELYSFIPRFIPVNVVDCEQEFNTKKWVVNCKKKRLAEGMITFDLLTLVCIAILSLYVCNRETVEILDWQVVYTKNWRCFNEGNIIYTKKTK